MDSVNLFLLIMDRALSQSSMRSPKKKLISDMPLGNEDHYLNQQDLSISNLEESILNDSKKNYYKSRLRIVSIIYIFAGLLYFINSIYFLTVYTDHDLYG